MGITSVADGADDCPLIIIGFSKPLDKIVLPVSRWKILQLKGNLISTFFIKRGSLETVTADQDHFTPPKTGFLFGRF